MNPLDFNFEKEVTEIRARLCLDCGKCTAVCPVAQLDSDFNPRLIVQRRLSGNGAAPSDESIWSCLGCYACVERCNYRVQFPDFINALRYEARQNGHEIRATHGGALQALIQLMSRGGIRQNRLEWLPGDIQLTTGSDTAFFVGCAPYFDVLFKDLAVDTVGATASALRILNRAGIPFTLLDNEVCCGHDQLLQGDRETAFRLARANLDLFKDQGIRRIITACPECFYTLKTIYPRITGPIGVEVVHWTEVLAPALQDLAPQLGEMDKRVTYHDPCRLGRCSGLYDQPRAILNSVAGLEITEMESNRELALCCGASPWAYCGNVNRRVQESRLAQAKATGAEMLVTACPKCLIHLKCAQKTGGEAASGPPIVDIAALLASLLG